MNYSQATLDTCETKYMDFGKPLIFFSEFTTFQNVFGFDELCCWVLIMYLW